MKKVLALLCLIICIVFFSFDDVKSSDVETIDFYNSNQKKSLDQLIKDTYGKSKIPIIYFYADWCGSCLSFKKSLSNKQVKKSLEKAVLIKINVDKDLDGEGITAKHSIKLIPTFIKIDKDGKVIARITSDKWNRDVPKNIAPVMDNLVNKTAYDKK